LRPAGGRVGFFHGFSQKRNPIELQLLCFLAGFVKNGVLPPHMSTLEAVRGHVSAEWANHLFVNGEFVKPVDGATYDAVYPATEEVFHTVPRGTAADVAAAVAGAQAAWDGGEGAWASMPAAERAEVVRRMAQIVRDNAGMLSEVESADTGKTLKDASIVVGGSAGEAMWWCDQGAVMDAEQDAPAERGAAVGGDPPASFKVVYRRDPVGVVGLISAWNYPINVAFRKVAPALVAGNCAILKPSEIAGISCMFLAKAAKEAGVPAGVFSVVTGDRDAGAALANSAAISMISFTGSSATGTKIMQSCAPRLAQSMLELGGKSALVVFPDVSVDDAVVTCMKGMLTNGGQICTAHTRLIIHRDIKEAVLGKLKEELEKLPFSRDPIAEDQQGDNAWGEHETLPGLVQAVASASQRDKIASFLAAAQASGNSGTVLTGGGVPAGMETGFFIQPTVFVEPEREAPVWQTEVFGPVLCVRSFGTEKEAAAEANSTAFGLASTVMSADAAVCRRVANKIRAGAVYATARGEGILAEFPNVQRGGYGCSGVGRELGLHGLYEYTELKSVNYTGFGDAAVDDGTRVTVGQGLHLAD